MKANSGGSPDGGRKRKYSETSSHRDRERERERDRDRFFGRSRESGFSKRPGGGDNYSDEEDESDRRGGYGRHSGRERRGENSGRDRDRDGRDDKRRGGELRVDMAEIFLGGPQTFLIISESWFLYKEVLEAVPVPLSLLLPLSTRTPVIPRWTMTTGAEVEVHPARTSRRSSRKWEAR